MVLTEAVIVFAASIIGYIVGALKPVLSEDYREDRIWCVRIEEIYENLQDELNDIDMRARVGRVEEEYTSALDSVHSTANELKEHVEEDYPNHRQEERQQAKEIIAEAEELAPPMNLSGNAREDEGVRRVEEGTWAEDVDYNAERLIDMIEQARENLLYGPVRFVIELLRGERTL